jgi:hypothetical protein
MALQCEAVLDIGQNLMALTALFGNRLPARDSGRVGMVSPSDWSNPDPLDLVK